MRKFLVSAAIIGLIASFPHAFAQDREHHDQAGPPRGQQHGGPQGGAPRGGPGPRGGGPEHAFRMQNGGGRQERPANQPSNAMRGPGPTTAMQPNQPPPNAPSNDRRGGREGFRGNAMRGPERGRDNAMRGPRRDFSGFRDYHRNFSAGRRFRAPAYRPPPGFFARRWAWGMTLPPLFWDRQYWLVDYDMYDLPPPPFGAIWVRVGDDALLIDQDDGTIISVAYGVFY